MEPHDPYASRSPDPYGRPRPVSPNPAVPPSPFAPPVGLPHPHSQEEAPLELTDDMLAEPAPQLGVDFERGMSRSPPFTIFMIVLLTVMFAWELGSGALKDEAAIMRAGALEKKAVLEQGEWWRIPTSMHLHGGLDHLIGNCLGLFLLGLAMEHAFGFWSAALIYFVAGVAGALASIALEGGPTVGASGAIFGWCGATIVFYFRYRSKLMARDTRVGGVLLIWAGWTILTGFLSPQVSNFSHLGGFLAGAAIAFLTPTRLDELREPVESP